jgi:hypothetical protein
MYVYVSILNILDISSLLAQRLAKKAKSARRKEGTKEKSSVAKSTKHAKGTQKANDGYVEQSLCPKSPFGTNTPSTPGPPLSIPEKVTLRTLQDNIDPEGYLEGCLCSV